MLLTKRDVIAIQNLLTKWANEAGIPISWKKIYLQYASEQLIADDEQVVLLARVAKELCPTR